MEVFYYDFLWSGLTYVILTYLAFRLMTSRKRRNEDGEDGDQGITETPKIDLPPGVVWPKDYISESEKEEVLV